MAFKHKRIPGSKSYANYTPETLRKALAKIRNGAGIRETSRSTLSRKLRNKNPNAYGRPKALNDADRKYLREGLLEYAKWACPLTRRDVQELVQHYLIERSRVEKRFWKNKPSSAWVKQFIDSDPELSERLSENVSRARISLTADIVNEFFDKFEKRLENVDPKFIINYDETCMVDDPGREVVIVSQREKHAKRIMDSSKSGTSVMFAATASGTLLPPYICYKSKNVYPTWKENGPKNAGYDCTKSGWFNAQVFENWFRHVVIPYCKRLDPTSSEKKILLGDNLASHTSIPVLALCKKYNIQFVLLPPNSTGDTQPLDVGYFRGLKSVWRGQVKIWKEKYKGAIPKEKFPRLLKQTLDVLEKDGQNEKNINGGFRGAGIFPVNRDEVLKKVPRQVEDAGDIQESWTKAFSLPLEKRRAEAYVRYKRTLRPAPGEDLIGTLTEDELADVQALSSDENEDPESEDSDEKEDSDLDEKEDSVDEQAKSETSVDIEVVDDQPLLTLKKGDFIIGKLIYNFGTSRQSDRQFVGKINDLNCGREKNQFEILFLRKKRNFDVNGETVYHFEYPFIADKWLLNVEQIIKKVEVQKIVRGKHYLLNVPYDVVE